MQQFHGSPASRERIEDNNRKQHASTDVKDNYRERRLTGEPAKFNTRTDQRRVIWENDLYERQSI
jgi:hypothetical protein